MTTPASHESVLMQEAVEALEVNDGNVFIDATFGRGGHSRSILNGLSATGKLYCIDKDPEAVAVAEAMAEEDPRLEVTHASFSQIDEIAQSHGIEGQVDGILFDLGVSSPQLDVAERGFSFLRDGPLDMRMNPLEGVSAAEWIRTVSEKDLADVLYQYGEERHSRRIARRIVAERIENEIVTTGRLSEIVKEANPSWERDKHPATRSFQAIRIFINQEFDELEQALEQALNQLKAGGRMVVISFHSLEDRIVKKFIAVQAKGDNFPRDLPIPQEMLKPRLKALGKARKASPEEIANNPRARSAIMRVAKKIA